MKRLLGVSFAALAMLTIGLAHADAPAIDPNAVALLAQADTAINKLTTFSANFTWEEDVAQAGKAQVSIDRTVGTVRLMKPNYVRIAGWEEKDSGSGNWQKGALREVYASDGTTFYHWDGYGAD